MSGFKDQIAADAANVFFCESEFAEKHWIKGAPNTRGSGCKVSIVMDADTLEHRGDKSGVQLGSIMFYVQCKDLDFIPQPEASLLFDKKLMTIKECKESAGVYCITLEQSI